MVQLGQCSLQEELLEGLCLWSLAHRDCWDQLGFSHLLLLLPLPVSEGGPLPRAQLRSLLAFPTHWLEEFPDPAQCPHL